MIKNIFILFLIFFPSVCFPMEKDEAVSLVKNYVNDMGNNILKKGYAFEKYYHPDYILLGHEKLDFIVVDKDYKIEKIEETKDSHNFNHEKKEKYIAVKIDFKKLGRFDNSDVKIKKEIFSKTFYCSRSTGKFLIIQTTDNEAMICFYSAAIKWLTEKSKSEKLYRKALKNLKSVH